jgi:benzoyl-CoA 2,3-dioxygenase component A
VGRRPADKKTPAGLDRIAGGDVVLPAAGRAFAIDITVRGDEDDPLGSASCERRRRHATASMCAEDERHRAGVPCPSVRGIETRTTTIGPGMLTPCGEPSRNLRTGRTDMDAISPEAGAASPYLKQHVIDPEVCIRCNTCEATCPVGAVTHDDNNYVVDAEKCNFCMDCIAPCPTGSIDNWRFVPTSRPYSIDEQFSWLELPKQEELGEADMAAVQAVEDEVERLLAEAHKGSGGKAVAPASAAKPTVNLYRRDKPAVATVQGNFRITGAGTESDVRHIVLSFGSTVFPVLEGQSIGIVPPGTRADGRPHDVRLYSIASARDGEKRNANNVGLTIKRVEGGVASNFMCDLKVGDKVEVTGPFGATFLMPNDANANILMICTGTGSAPFRAFTERRRRAMQNAAGKLVMFFGARTPEELPYFGPLQKVPATLLEQHLVFSRVPGAEKEYVQDRMRREADGLATLLASPHTHIFICGLKEMESGVEEALADIARKYGVDWSELKPEMRRGGRYHVETY